jgi:hypothetical protein
LSGCDVLYPKNIQACGYHVPPSVESVCLPYFLTKSLRNLSAATRIFLSKEIRIPRIVLAKDSTQTHAY